MTERVVWTALIVVDALRFDLRLGVINGRELVDVQALIAQSAVEGLDEGIFHRFSGPNEIELHRALIRPVFERSRHELRAVIDGDRAGRLAVGSTRSKATPTVAPERLEATSRIGL